MNLLILLLAALILTVNGCLRVRWPEKCSPTDPSIFLFAYSNDMNYTEVLGKLRWLEVRVIGRHHKYVVAATVRFDTKRKEEIVFYANDTMSNSFLTARDYVNITRDPSQSFDNSETGSDVLDMLDRYIDSGHPLICGSRAFIFIKRSPNEVEISKIVRKIRQYHIELNIAFENPTSGGLHPETIYNLAAKTNGYCTFSNGTSRAMNTLPEIFRPYTYYSLSLNVSGTGTMVLPSITLSEKTPLHLFVSVQSTATTTSFQNFSISYVSTQGFSGSISANREDLQTQPKLDYHVSMNTFRLINFIHYAEASTYNMTLEYSYSMEDTILIRLNSEEPIDHWLPFQD